MKHIHLLIYLIPLILKSQTQLSFSIEGIAGFIEGHSTKTYLYLNGDSYLHDCGQLFTISRQYRKDSAFFKGFSPSFDLKIGNHKINIIWDPFFNYL